MALKNSMRAWMIALALASWAQAAAGEDLPEYRLKAAFLYNFALFTEWPADVGSTLNVCILGKDPFGGEIDPLQGKKIGERSIAVHRKASVESLAGCQVVFIASTALGELPRVHAALPGGPVLTVADNAAATGKGVALNMIVSQNKIVFDADLAAARGTGVRLSSKLLRLAREVRQ
jgi:hypothetical protein